MTLTAWFSLWTSQGLNLGPPDYESRKVIFHEVLLFVMFDKEHKWMTGQMKKHIREVNEMFYDERKRVRERYKEYDGTYLGHYVQYFVWFFFALGVIIFGLTIYLLLDSHYHWSK